MNVMMISRACVPMSFVQDCSMKDMMKRYRLYFVSDQVQIFWPSTFMKQQCEKRIDLGNTLVLYTN